MNNLYDVESTGSPIQKTILSIATAGLLWGISGTFQNSNHELILTNSQLKQAIDNSSPFGSSHILTAKQQLLQIKNNLGLNISEMAAIFLVSRPTIYEWLESIEPRRRHQERLNTIYQICNFWIEQKIGRLGSLLHKPLNVENDTLFKLLTKELLDKNSINSGFKQIVQIISDKKQKDEVHEAVLRKYGFKPISSEERDSRLDDMEFLD